MKDVFFIEHVIDLTVLLAFHPHAAPALVQSKMNNSVEHDSIYLRRYLIESFEVFFP